MLPNESNFTAIKKSLMWMFENCIFFPYLCNPSILTGLLSTGRDAGCFAVCTFKSLSPPFWFPALEGEKALTDTRA